MDENYSEIIEILCRKTNYDIALIIIKHLYFIEHSIECPKCKRKVLREEIIDSEYLCSENVIFVVYVSIHLQIVNFVKFNEKQYYIFCKRV